MEVNEFIQAINKVPDALLKSYEVAAAGAFVLVQNRIQEHGLSHDGQPLTTIKPYSKQYLNFKQDPPPGSGLKNRYRGFIDYTLTGRMWSNIQQKQSNITGEIVTVVIGAVSDDNQKKLENLSRIWEDVFLMGTQEIEITAETLDEELQRQLDILFR
jgi:hypothetical protein